MNMDGYIADPRRLPLRVMVGDRLLMGLVSPEYICEDGEHVWRETIDGLEIRVVGTCHPEYHVCTWVFWVANRGAVDSSMVSDLRFVHRLEGAEPVLESCNGDFYDGAGYTVTTEAMPPFEKRVFAPVGGRSCDKAFPYYKLFFEGYHLNLAIGWPGQWQAEFARDDRGVVLDVRQQTLATILRPGEEIRSPKVVLQWCDGGIAAREGGINDWRRYMRDCVQPANHEPFLALMDNHGGDEFTTTTEAQQVEAIRWAKEQGLEATHWWIDAGWYPCRYPDGRAYWPLTGTWEPDPARYPNGLKPVAQACREAGMDLLVWFEPERVQAPSKLVDEHPEFLLHPEHKAPGKAGENQNMLFNLADTVACDWLIDKVVGLLTDNDIRYYRQDYNFPPLRYWRAHEGEGRWGVVENLYVQGYLRYWDALLARVPGLKIDSCASGGRRNDIETMARSVPLHPTDYGYGYHHVNQSFRHTLYSWIPFTRAFSSSWDVDGEYVALEDIAKAPVFGEYQQINGLGVASAFANLHELRKAPQYVPLVREMTAIWKQFAPRALEGDFYALTPNHRDAAQWTAFQFHNPVDGTGVVQVLRNDAARDETLTVQLRGVTGPVVLTNARTGEPMCCDGEATFAQPMRSGSVWFY